MEDDAAAARLSARGRRGVMVRARMDTPTAPPAAAVPQSWYRRLYCRIVENIDLHDVMSRFPGRTEADLYLWIMDHRYFLTQKYGHDVGSEEATMDFRAQHSPPLYKRLGQRMKLVLRGKRLGFTLAEIRELFDLYDLARDEQRQLEEFLAKLEKRRALLEQQREDIEVMLNEIAFFEMQCKKLLAEPAENSH